MTKEEFLQIAAKRYDDIRSLNNLDNFYDYEKSFDKIMTEVSSEILEKNISHLTKDRRKKKHLPNLVKLK